MHTSLHYALLVMQVEVKGSKGQSANLAVKCKGCGRTNSASAIKHKKVQDAYTSDDSGNAVMLGAFDFRGIEPIQWILGVRVSACVCWLGCLSIYLSVCLSVSLAFANVWLHGYVYACVDLVRARLILSCSFFFRQTIVHTKYNPDTSSTHKNPYRHRCRLTHHTYTAHTADGLCAL